jgi:tetratricopeptide (TPR) repeat protein
MSAKPSRTELETALAGGGVSGSRKTPHRTDPIELQLDSMTARRQKVIGGDLTGVSKRQKAGRGSRGREINYVNWIAIGIVLLILGVFFWPEDSNVTTKEATGSEQVVESALYYTESRVDDTQPSTTAQSFLRETDIDRASEFREQEALEKQIQTLLTEAHSNVANGRYTLPEDNNAIDAYQQILKLDPNNITAKQGIESINDRFLSNGQQALEENKERVAVVALQKLNAIDSRSDARKELAAALKNWRQSRKISDLLASASKASEEQRIILPARNNALYFYQQILELDPQNEAGLAGTQAIADSYIEKANSAILNGQFEAATGYLATVSVINPKHDAIPMIEGIISKGAEISALNPSPSSGELSLNENTSNTQQQSEARATQPQQIVSTDSRETLIPKTTANRNNVSTQATPKVQASEQAAFDRQYLERGLDAYYKGNYETAAALLQPLADKGVSRAQFRIGYMYYLGRGFTRDRAEADRVIRAAVPAIQKFANEGRVWAQSDLGSLYEDGLVLPQDYAKALYWYRSAAEQGYPGAQTNLGIMYAQGYGVTASRRTAIEWFQRAAKQGDIAAKRNLDSMGITQ